MATYTPNGIPKAEGYDNPDNPYDTGRPGEKNTELNGGVGGTPDGWNRDTLTWDGTINNPTSGGGGGGGGSNLFGNPYYAQYQSQLEAAKAADLTDTKSQLQQLLIQFGMVPGNFEDKIGALDDTIRALIEKNTTSGISQYARLQESKGDITRESMNQLSARGLGRSGAKGYKLRRNQLGADRTLADTIAAVLGNANSLQSGYAGREMGRQQSLAQFLAQLSASFRPTGGYATPSYQPPAPQYSAPAPATTYAPLPGPTGTMNVGGQQVDWYRPPTSGGGGRFIVD